MLQGPWVPGRTRGSGGRHAPDTQTGWGLTPAVWEILPVAAIEDDLRAGEARQDAQRDERYRMNALPIRDRLEEFGTSHAIPSRFLLLVLFTILGHFQDSRTCGNWKIR